MSRHSKPMNLARLNDAVLGSFASVPSSSTLDHLVRYLSTWSGSEYVAVHPVYNSLGAENDAVTSASFSWLV